MAGLAPSGIRQTPPEVSVANDDIVVEVGGDPPDKATDLYRIEHGDGAVTISLGGQSLFPDEEKHPPGWFDNLVDDIDQMELARISNDLLRGIDDDKASRTEWTESIATGIQLLGLKIEVPGLQGAADGAPVEGMSKVRHPILLEAVLRFQANARSEMLPTDGPVKIRDDSSAGSPPEHDLLGTALEKDLNHYLTVHAPEYYPDTDKMFFKLGFAGISFKKVYFCPLRMRPVSETVDADDLIVNNATTDLSNAKRITHRVMMRPSVVKRLQILGVYRDIQLSDPNSPDHDAVKREEKSQQGVSADSMRPEDRDREIYECYCELDIKGFEHKWKGKPSGLEIPYRVTLDVTSKEVLSIVRNYNEGRELPRARKVFVPFIFVPGFGFYAIGLLHILGNTTNAVTAAWREMLDNGMYANFPGFLQSDIGGRQNTNIFRVPPGGGAQVKTGGLPIGDVVMPLPYNTTQMPALMALVQDMAQTGMRIGGTSELQVGEGRADAPVGTTLAMIDQATKVLNSVHKRMHAAQAEEFQLLVECFREHPESFLERDCASNHPWTQETFLQALNDCDLVPQADPNTASHSQRLAKVTGLILLAMQQPGLFDSIKVATVAVQALGWTNPEQFLVPPSAMGQPPPEMVEMQARAKAQQQDADARMIVAKAKEAEVQAKIQQGAYQGKGLGAAAGKQQPTQIDAINAQSKLMDAQTRRQQLGIAAHDSQTSRMEAQLREREMGVEDENRDLDRASRDHIELMKLARDIVVHPALNPEEAERQQQIARDAAQAKASQQPKDKSGG